MLVEVDADVLELCVTLTPCDAAAASARHEVRAANAGRPLAFAFADLQSATSFTVAVSDGLDGAPLAHTPSVLRTQVGASEGVGKARIGVVSCNKIYHTEQKARVGGADAWVVLRSRLELPRSEGGGLDVLLHLGDQVYVDHDYYKVVDGRLSARELQAKLAAQGANCAFLDARLLLDATPGGRARWREHALPRVLELFRDVYRRTWSWPATAAVLANVPNIMLPDDHGLRDDWGDRRKDYDRGSADFFLGHAAYTVYREYQAALVTDVPVLPPATLAPFLPVNLALPDLLGAHSVGLLTVDTRIKAFTQAEFPYRDCATEPLLGQPQWRSTLAALGPGGAHEETRVLVLATPIPLCWMGARIMQQVALRVDDALGMWGHPRNEPELLRLLQALRAWKGAREAREVLVLGGDVHAGGVTEIKGPGGELLFRQLTASPVANETMPWWQAAASVLGKELVERVAGGEFTFEHTQHEHRCQFGVVGVPLLPPAENSGSPGGDGAPVTAPTVELELELVAVGDEPFLVTAIESAASGSRGCSFCSLM